MRRAFSASVLIATLLLHAAILLAITRANAPLTPPELLPITIELLPPMAALAEPPAPSTAVPVVAPEPEPAKPEPIRKQEKPKVKPKPKPKPAPKPKPESTPEPRTATRPAPTAPEPAASQPEPAAPAPAVAGPAPDNKPSPPSTAVYISANYAARNRPPDYPAMSRRYGEQGTVRLRVLVQADGTAGAVEIARSSGYALLDEAARNAVRNWRFQPATKDGRPVADWYLTPVVFTLEN